MLVVNTAYKKITIHDSWSLSISVAIDETAVRKFQKLMKLVNNSNEHGLIWQVEVCQKTEQ
jgi:hypothetical protein